MTDDTDICEVLRRAEERECIFWTTDGDLAVSPTLFGAAADEIERLRTEVAELRRHTHSCPYSDAEFWCMCAGPDHDADCLYDDEQENNR
jgi:hypothetical protein